MIKCPSLCAVLSLLLANCTKPKKGREKERRGQQPEGRKEEKSYQTRREKKKEMANEMAKNGQLCRH